MQPEVKERGKTTNDMIRLSPEELAEVDALIKQGKYTSRSNAMKMALQHELRREMWVAEFRKNMIIELEDPAIRTKLKTILIQALTEPEPVG